MFLYTNYNGNFLPNAIVYRVIVNVLPAVSHTYAAYIQKRNFSRKSVVNNEQGLMDEF